MSRNPLVNGPTSVTMPFAAAITIILNLDLNFILPTVDHFIAYSSTPARGPGLLASRLPDDATLSRFPNITEGIAKRARN